MECYIANSLKTAFVSDKVIYTMYHSTRLDICVFLTWSVFNNSSFLIVSIQSEYYQLFLSKGFKYIWSHIAV